MGAAIGVAALVCMVVWLTAQTTAPTSVPVISKAQPRLPLFGPWCTIYFNESHRGWSANQPPDEWTRFMLPMPSSASAVQLTAYDADGKLSPGGWRSLIMEGYAAYGVLYVALEYWDVPWTLYIGAKTSPSFFKHENMEAPCQGVVLWQGKPPQTKTRY